MTLLELLLSVHESDDLPAALRVVAGWAPVRAASWAPGERGRPAPADLERAPAGPGEETARVPVEGSGGSAELRLDAAARVPDGELRRIAAALGRVAEREARLRAAREECDTLRKRAEESEALHVLGLSANRSLDPDEVLGAVARFSRTLLGSHYVVVSTEGEDAIETVAAVGLRDGGGLAGDALAARVMEQGKPLVVGPGEDEEAAAFPSHQAEGMRVGLGVPLSLFGTTFGALVAGYRRDYQVEPRDVRLALTLAGHAAVAISNARLHRALAERSRELERANRELRWTSQVKERFFATMSHELRTPLNAILGYQSLLLEGLAGELPERQRGYVANANRATQTLLHLVNDVLDLSKIEAGKMELVARPATVARIVADTLNAVGPMAEAKGIGLLVDPLSDLPEMLTDEDRVRQILLNLLSNAVKFTERGEVRVSAAVESARPPRVPETAADPATGWIRILVTDTGSGIEPDDQERIFHEFEQVLGTGSRGGTGLGLPISRKLARLLGGELYVESEPGVGSTFVLHLPLRLPLPTGTGIATEAKPE